MKKQNKGQLFDIAEYIEFVNWQDFQHYKRRNPPWIRLYVKLLDDENFEHLPDKSKLLLMLLWLFNSRKGDGMIVNDEKYLRKKLPFRGKVNLQPLIDAGFITIVTK